MKANIDSLGAGFKEWYLRGNFPSCWQRDLGENLGQCVMTREVTRLGNLGVADDVTEFPVSCYVKG